MSRETAEKVEKSSLEDAVALPLAQAIAAMPEVVSKHGDDNQYDDDFYYHYEDRGDHLRDGDDDPDEEYDEEFDEEYDDEFDEDYEDDEEPFDAEDDEDEADENDNNPKGEGIDPEALDKAKKLADEIAKKEAEEAKRKKAEEIERKRKAAEAAKKRLEEEEARRLQERKDIHKVMGHEFDQIELSSLAPIELAETPTLEIEAELKQHVFGQDEALRLVAQAIVRNRARIVKDGRPIGSFLFYGPTGVGKTELSKALAAFMFGDPDSERRVAIDMSEFSQAHTIARFVGSPPGYIGSSEHSAIPHELFKKGETILVLDEIEKAHPDIIQLFLGVTEEGRLSARNGSRGHETINFENTVVIFTSNAGSAELAEAQTTRAIGFHGEETRPDLNRVGERALRRRFSPEFLNRVDRVMFKPLEMDSHLRIIDKLLVDLNNAVMMSNAPLVWMSEAAKCLLLSRANTQQYHGRDIRRVFKTDVEHRLSEFYLSKQLDQSCNLVIDAVNGEYVYRAFPVSSDR